MFAAKIIMLPRASTWFERVARLLRDIVDEVEEEIREAERRYEEERETG